MCSITSIGQKGFIEFIKVWKILHDSKNDRLGVVRDYDNQDKAKKEHEEYNSYAIHVETSEWKEFEYDLVNTGNNLELLNKIFNINCTSEGMYKHLVSDKLNNIIKICQMMDKGKLVSIPNYIVTILAWMQR